MNSIDVNGNLVSNMIKRTLTAIVLIAYFAIFLVCGYFVDSIFLDLFVYIFAICGSFELISCLKKSGYKMFYAPVIFALVTMYPAYYCMDLYFGLGNFALVVLFLLASMLTLTIYTFKPAKHTQEEVDKCKEIGVEIELDGPKAHELKDLLANVFVLIYPLLFMAATLNLVNRFNQGSASMGLFTIIFAVFVPILGSDTFAYFLGSMIGGKKLCPKVSPKKTVAGGIGGLIGGMVFAIVLWVIFEYYNLIPANENYEYYPFISHCVEGWAWKTALIYLAIGLVCGAVSELGDLAASRIKRSIGIKDFGKIFPGHGGFLDRMDSVMYCSITLIVAFTIIYIIC